MLRFVPLLALVLVLSAAAEDVASLSDQALLTRVDSYRIPDESSRYQVRIVNREGGATVDEDLYSIASKGNRSLIEMLSPRSKGQTVLVLEQQMWLKVPKSKNVIRITPLQRLSGQASYSDLGRLKFGQYAVASREAQDGALVLSLKGSSKDLVYPTATLWVDASHGFPLKAEVFLPSGKKFRTLTFTAPTTVLGRPMITGYTITDELHPELQSDLQVSGIAPQTLPDTLFTLARLEGQ